jgi:nucleotide-binding universal stress UspA family protein
MVTQFGGKAYGRYVLAKHPQLRGRHVTWLPEVDAEQRGAAALLVRTATEYAAGQGVDLDITVIDGDPVDELLRAAEDLHADTILIGNRGQSALSALLMGSVAQGVTERSRVPVLVVHAPPTTDAGEPALAKMQPAAV